MDSHHNPNNDPELHEDSMGEFILYQNEDSTTEVHLRLIDGSIWLTQTELSDLYGISISTVSRHVKSILEEGELTREATVALRAKVGLEQGRNVARSVETYNLDMIMAIGYRVRGPRGIQFRTWASEVLKEYLIKGFAMNDEKLKDPRGMDYFDELLARIRDIRSSEARLYSKIQDIFSLADDYDPKNPDTRLFFQKIQNKLHYAITGLTSSEIIATRCDPAADNLGLTSFKGKKVRKGDVGTAKNYLEADELDDLNRLVSQFLDYAESQAKRRKVVHMKDWLEKTDKFIEFNDYEPLGNAGRISATEAKRLAGERYAIYDSARRRKENDLADDQLIGQLQSIERRILADRTRMPPRTIE